MLPLICCAGSSVCLFRSASSNIRPFSLWNILGFSWYRRNLYFDLNSYGDRILDIFEIACVKCIKSLPNTQLHRVNRIYVCIEFSDSFEKTILLFCCSAINLIWIQFTMTIANTQSYLHLLVRGNRK